MTTFMPMTRMIDAAFKGTLDNCQTGEHTPNLTPRADVLESETEFRLVLDLPGVKTSDLEINVEKQTLIVKAGKETTGAHPNDHRPRLYRPTSPLCDEAIGHVRCLRNLRILRQASQDRCGIGASDIDGVHKQDRPSPARVVTTFEDPEFQRRRGGHPEAATNRGFEVALGVLEGKDEMRDSDQEGLLMSRS